MTERSRARHVAVHLGSALTAVTCICLAAQLGSRWLGMRTLVTLGVPILAVLCFVVGFSVKILRWITAPVPFRIPLTLGQQRSLASIHHAVTCNPHTAPQAVLRAALDILLFRPLLRPTPSASLHSGQLSRYAGYLLWLGTVAFHGSLLVILLRHLRLFITPVPAPVVWLQSVDSVSDLYLPKVHISTLVFFVSVLFLVVRRLVLVRLRYISLAADYFPLALLGGIAITGFWLRHVTRTDVATVKIAMLDLAHLSAAHFSALDSLFVVHWSLVCTLLAYFPLSKLMHAPGAFMSPTLTLANSNRVKRHINVCNPKVQLLHYADYEATFRERMVEAGLPVEEP